MMNIRQSYRIRTLIVFINFLNKKNVNKKSENRIKDLNGKALSYVTKLDRVQ